MADIEKASESTTANAGPFLASEAYIASTLPITDLEHPWLGLESFQEETRAYFFGRDAEIDELHLRLRNLPLLVLYGRSGLGKTSILKAGLIPRLREQNQLPLLLRLHYSDTTSDPCSQLASAVFSEKMDEQAEPVSSVQSIEWVRCLGEKLKLSLPEDIYSLLWLRLHCRDEPPAISHLIIDQFEEVFTLGAQYPGVENCVRDILAILLQRVIPQSISSLILKHKNFLDHFDPDSIPVRVVLALRDDYIYALNRWRRHLPALSQNNFELRALRGSAAFDAVYKPGTLRCHYQGKVNKENKIETGLLPIISEETAEKIMRSIAEKSDDVPLEEIEVNSPILSLLCRQLNDHRFSQSPCAAHIQFGGKADIDTIIAEFYDSCLAERPKAIRTFIEEGFISSKGARLAQDEASILAAFEKGYNKHRNENWFVRGYGNAADARACLYDLVSRRLLSPVAGDKPRYELTHDLLVKIVEKRRTEASAQRKALEEQQEQHRNTQAEALVEMRNIISKVNGIAFLVFIAIVILWINAEIRVYEWGNHKPIEHKSYQFKEQIENSEKLAQAKKDAQVIFNYFGVKVEVLYPATILSILTLMFLIYLRRARNQVMCRFSERVAASLDLGTDLSKAPQGVWWLAPLPIEDGDRVSAKQFQSALQWNDSSRGNTISVALASFALVIIVCRFTYLGLVLTKDLLRGEVGYWQNIIWLVILIFCVVWKFFLIYAWWSERRVPEFKNTQIQFDHGRRKFYIAVVSACIAASLPVAIPVFKKIWKNPRYLKLKRRRSENEPLLSIGAFRQNTNSGIFHGVLPSKPAQRLARKTIPVVHCLPLKPEAMEPIEDIAVLRSITFTAADGKDAKKKPHVQLARSACAYEQAALARIVSNDIEGACQLLLCGVQHDLLYSKMILRRPSIHIYDLLVGLTIRYEKPQHFKTLNDLIDKQQILINIVRRCDNIQLDPINVIYKRQQIWEDTTSNWHKRWANKSKPLKWSGVPM